MSHTITRQLEQALLARDAVFIVGTGVTISATGLTEEASWPGLIRSGVSRCVDLDPASQAWETRAQKLLATERPSDWLEVAQDVKDRLTRQPGSQFAKWLRETAGSLGSRIDRPGLPDLIGSFGVPIATTNYDDVLEIATGRNTAIVSNVGLVQNEVSDPGHHVIHLHGHWAEPDSVVFGYQSYASAIGEQQSRNLLKALATMKQIIFIGFGNGLADPNFTYLGTWLTSEMPGNQNAPIVLTIDREYERVERESRHLGYLAMSVGATYVDLEIYLADLLRNLPAAGRPPEGTRTYSWDSLASKLVRLSRRIDRDFRPDFMVSMSGPGNFAPAYCLAHFSHDPAMLVAVTFPKRPMSSGNASRFRGIASDSDWIHLETARWDIFLPNAIRHFPPGSRALIFDDRVVGGNSQRQAKQLLSGLGYETRTAALVIHPERKGEIDFYEECTEDDFTFPWGGKYGRNEPLV